MPFPNEHAARQRDPGDFVRIVELWAHGGIRALGGPLISDPRGGAVVQTFRFDKSKWTVAEAKGWLSAHGHKTAGFEEAREVKALDMDLTDPGFNEIIATDEED